MVVSVVFSQMLSINWNFTPTFRFIVTIYLCSL